VCAPQRCVQGPRSVARSRAACRVLDSPRRPFACPPIAIVIAAHVAASQTHPTQVQRTALEVLKVFGPNVTEASMQKRHDGISLEQWVRGEGGSGACGVLSFLFDCGPSESAETGSTQFRF
jgi:hypothetical protein